MRSAVLLCALAGLAAGPAPTAEKVVDADLLEFLGSLDSDEAGWHDYLEQGAVKPVGKPPVKAPTSPPDGKQVKSK
ncbi:MAG: hypothetical protein ABI859_20410 [Pseudomonadota bacterium]